MAVSYTHLDVYKRQLLDRATLSQKNLWIDERGFVFVIFTICSLAEQLGRSTVSVSSCLLYTSRCV